MAIAADVVSEKSTKSYRIQFLAMSSMCMPAFMSLKDLSMLSELKYDRDMDMN